MLPHEKYWTLILGLYPLSNFKYSENRGLKIGRTDPGLKIFRAMARSRADPWFCWHGSTVNDKKSWKIRSLSRLYIKFCLRYIWNPIFRRNYVERLNLSRNPVWGERQSIYVKRSQVYETVNVTASSQSGSKYISLIKSYKIT